MKGGFRGSVLVWAAIFLLACGGDPGRAQSSSPEAAAPGVVSAPAPSSSAAAVPVAPGPIPSGMVLVPEGPFLRGSLPGIGLEDEHPQRSITLAAFLIDVTEVTQADYARCVEAGRCVAPKCKSDRPTDWDPTARATHPVVCISWSEAKAFCAFAGKRLPTEAEWEKAARGEDGRLYPWGNDAPTCERANYYECDRKGTEPVGSHPSGKSPYGALDMAGNVWEWTADFHLADYYVASPAKDPEGPSDGDRKVVRGGAFKYGASELLSAGRTYDAPTVHFEHVGVRCAKSR